MMRSVLLALTLVLSPAAMAAHAPASEPSSISSSPLPVDTVKCKDGSSALLPIKQGTCSGHGGVAKTPKDPPAAVPPTPDASPAVAAPPKGATAQCKDGTFSMSKTHSGACSGHGGVDKWL